MRVLRGLVAGLGTFATFVGVGVLSAQALPQPDQTLVRTWQGTTGGHTQSVVAAQSALSTSIPLTALPKFNAPSTASSPPPSASLPPQREATPVPVPTTIVSPSAADTTPDILTTEEHSRAATAPLTSEPQTTAPGSAPVNRVPSESAARDTTAAPVATPVTEEPPSPASLSATPPDVRLIRHGGQGYWLEVTPPAAPLPTSVARSKPSLRTVPQRSFVPAAETTGYRGVPAPPVVGSSNAAVSNYSSSSYVTVRNQSNYQPPPSPPQVFTLPPAFDQGGSALHYPLPSVVPVTSGFGWRVHPLTGDRRFHSGVDLGAAAGTPVLAALSGQIVAAAPDGGYGLRVLVQSQRGDRSLQTLYAHLSGVTVTVGQVVQAGQVIGYVGSSGASTGPHLHFELRELMDSRWESVDSQPLLTASLQAQSRSDWSLVQGTTTPTLLPTASTTGITMRVALAQNAVALQLATSTPAWILDAQQQSVGVLPAGQNFVTAPNTQGIQLGSLQLPSAFFLQPSGDGLIAVGGQWYRGRLLVLNRPGGLTVVNWVNLEQYLTSVVGAEAYPSWGMEALKAQAVAARSYALKFHVNPAHALFDLDATTRYQAYRGTETEFSSTLAAVTQTTGQIMLTGGGQILLAEYASTQALTDEAHRGLGMSQWGAADLAQQGYDYRQILGHYYQGASLTVLATAAP